MARQPKLVLRESAIEDAMRGWPIGSFLETGAGTGYMTKKFLDLGFYGACFEISQLANVKILENLFDYRERIKVVNSLNTLGELKYDYLLSFEVLEHIEDDLAALVAWTKFLKPNGKILLSVPAHRRKYSKADEIVGHVRRYEREDLIKLLDTAGYKEIVLWNYGYPISELTRFVSNMLIKDANVEYHLSLEQRSMQSSYMRHNKFRSIINFFGESWLTPFTIVQRWFYNFDFSDGIIATAKKRS